MKGRITIKGLNVDMENSPIIDKLRDVNDKVDKLIEQMEKDNQPGFMSRFWTKTKNILSNNTGSSLKI